MKKTVAVIFGGQSVEHDVSIITAHVPIIASLLASGKYEPLPVYIAKDGSWHVDPAMNDLAFFKRPDYEAVLARQKRPSLLFDHGLKFVWAGFRPKTVAVDVVFPALHGTYGEDGSLMGLLRMAGVPFVGCDMASSAVAMDKAFTKQVLSAEGIPVVPYVWFTHDEWDRDRDGVVARMKRLHRPVFVKPVHLGSSIGITKAKDEDALTNAIEVALHYDDKVLVEESVEHLIEATLPIMGNDEPRPAEVERPLNKTEFFNFDDKYLSGGKKGQGVNTEYSEIPANIGADLTRAVKELGVRVYRTLGCTGIARVDFLIDAGMKKVFVNEVNTLPGSLYHHNWRKAGVSNVELVTTLVALAEERFARAHATAHTFQSDILSKVGGSKTGGASPS